MANMKIIAIAAAIIVVAAAAVAVVSINDNDDGSFSIVDGKGTTHTFDGPIDGAVLCNTNIPKAMKILGFEDNVKGLSFYSSKTDTSNWNLFSPLFDNAKHMSTTKEMTGEEIISEANVKYVIAPVSSMTVSEAQETSYNQLGIKVIRLDCNGDSSFDDFEKLIKLFTGNSSNDAYDEYKETYNSVMNTVVNKVQSAASTADKTFLCYMDSKETFYNQTSDLSMNIEKIYGKNALRDIPTLDKTGVTNDATQDGLKEAVIALDDSNNIEKVFVRASASNTASATKAIGCWNDCVVKQNYGALSAIAAGEVYVINTDLMSGPLSYIAFIIYAETNGIDTGYNVATLIDEYNDKYGFTERTNGAVYKISNGTATEIVIT